MIYGIYYVDRQFYAQWRLQFRRRRRVVSEADGRGDSRAGVSVDRKNTLQDIFQQLQDEMRQNNADRVYALNPAKDGTFRKIDVRTGNKDWKVQARKGYYAIKPEQQ